MNANPVSNEKNYDTYKLRVEEEEKIEDVVRSLKSIFDEANLWNDDIEQEIDPAQYNEILNPTPF